jgi:hypothetical protein
MVVTQHNATKKWADPKLALSLFTMSYYEQWVAWKKYATWKSVGLRRFSGSNRLFGSPVLSPATI